MAYIIAEAGVNHNGDMKLACQMIAMAAKSGADAIKFQSFKADRLASLEAEKASYQKETTVSDESQHAMLKKLELSERDHKQLMDCCYEAGIEFLSTPFDIDSAIFLADCGVKRIKIPSGEITNLPYLQAVGSLGLPIIMSTGMATIGEVEDAVRILETAGTSRESIVVLHANTEYPTPYMDVNLRAMITLGQALGVNVGYSDHTLGIEIPVAAVALGAKVIEKHFTTNRELHGPDHKASLLPGELEQMVRSIRNVELALGDGIKRPSASEVKNILIARKSIAARRNIVAGEFLNEENLTTLRPATGISPMRWNEVIGSIAKRDYRAGELI